jgi:23S rRNA (pseudouridine1915-N3)-methyltransferase|tara:strand:+ start:191 stop:649 length:459 start_codon:yes stop_codon:yes gene_type:complete
MNIIIIAVGRIRSGPEKTLIENYSRRIKWPIEFREVEEKKKLKGLELKKRQGDLLLNQCPPESKIIVLDQCGKNLPSTELANVFKNWQGNRVKEVCMLIGGADGVDQDLRKKADLLLSFGQLTWPHMLARVMLTEQIYRSQQIINGHPYHRE